MLLSTEIVKTHQLSLSGCFDLSPDGAILLQSWDNIFDLAGKNALLKQENSGLEYFSFTKQGALLTISHQMLGYYKDGELVERVKLPTAGMKLASAGEDLLYLYGGNISPNTNIYIYCKGGGYKKFLEAPEKVLSLTTAGDKIFFSIRNDIYTAKLGEKLSLICLMPGPSVQSLAYDPASGILYFSAGEAVYSLKQGKAYLVSEHLGEDLRFYQGSLYVLSPKYGTLFRLAGLETRNIVSQLKEKRKVGPSERQTQPLQPQTWKQLNDAVYLAVSAAEEALNGDTRRPVNIASGQLRQ